MGEIALDSVLAKVKEDIQIANKYFEGEIESKVKERYQITNADQAYYKKMFPRLSKTSEITSSDVADTIEWIMPQLMRIFFGSDEPVTIQPVTAEDEQPAQINQDLLKFQLERKNKGFMKFYNWFKDSLITNLGIVKCYWDREVEKTIKEDLLGIDELQMLKQDQDIKIIEVTAYPPTLDLFTVKYQVSRIIKNQPKIENILASEFRWSPDAKTLEEADFVAHRKICSIDYIRRKAKDGVYKDIDRLEQKLSDPQYTSLEEENNKYITEINKAESARKKVILYECYTKLDIDGDGLLENVIVTICEDVILRIEENTYGRHPFFVLSPIISPHKVWSDRGYVDLIGQLQHLKTALIRQIVTNISKNNRPQKYVNLDAIEDINDLIEDREVIRVNTDVGQAIKESGIAPLAPWTFNFLEYVDTLKENRTGVTRYNQGLDANSLNKTATGISTIVQQASQRMELVARIFAETGVTELFQFMVNLNQKFIDQGTVIRLTNQTYTVRADDLQGEFDYAVNAGMGMGSKQNNIQNMQMLLGIAPTLSQYGLMTLENAYNVIKKLLEEMGYKNVDEYITNPMRGGLMNDGGQATGATDQAMAAGGAIQGMPAAHQISPAEPEGGILSAIGGMHAGAGNLSSTGGFEGG